MTNPFIDPYGRAKTTQGNVTPTNKDNKYNRGKEYLQQWESLIPGISKWSNKKAQSAIYDFMLQSDEGKGRLSEMWREFGLTNEGKKYKNLLGMTNKGVFDPNKELDDAQLTQLKKAYVDGMFGARQVTPPDQDLPIPTLTPVNPPAPPADPVVPEIPVPPAQQPPRDYSVRSQPKSRFFEPLRWFDVASPIQSLLSAERLPVNYDAPQFNQIKLAQQNPLPTLQNAQTDYNTAIQTLDPTTGFGMANTANLFSKKYAMDNQVLGQFENANTQIRNQEIMYNANVRDRQSASDVQSRQAFEEKYLGAKEAQRLQTLTAWDDLFTRVAQNRRLNREGNLMMQLFPAFDQYAQHNGYQMPLRNPLNVPNAQGAQGNVQYITDPQTGSRYRVIIGADGKPISNSKVISDDKAAGAKPRTATKRN